MAANAGCNAMLGRSNVPETSAMVCWSQVVRCLIRVVTPRVSSAGIQLDRAYTVCSVPITKRPYLTPTHQRHWIVRLSLSVPSSPRHRPSFLVPPQMEPRQASALRVQPSSTHRVPGPRKRGAMRSVPFPPSPHNRNMVVHVRATALMR